MKVQPLELALIDAKDMTGVADPIACKHQHSGLQNKLELDTRLH